MKELLNNIKRTIVKITINIGSFFKKVAKMIWNQLLVHIYIFFRKIFKFIFNIIAKFFKFVYRHLIKKPSIFIYRYILKPPYKALKVGVIKVYGVLKKVALSIYKHFIYKIFIGIEYVFIFIEKFLINIARVLKMLFKHIKTFFVNLYLSFKLLYFKTPELIYNFLYLLFIYFYLIIKFILIDFLFDIFIKLPYKLLYKIFNFIYKIIYEVFSVLIKYLKLIFKVIKEFIIKLYLIFRDFNEYFVVIILIPVLLPLFIVGVVVLYIVEIPKYFNFIIKGIFGKRIYSKYEIVSVKTNYNPIKTIYLNVYSYYIDLKIEEVKSSSFKQIIINFKITNNRVIYRFVILPLISLLISPLLIFRLFKTNKKFTKEDLVVLNTRTFGIIYLKSINIGSSTLSLNLLTDYSNVIKNGLYVINEKEASFKMNILLDNKVVRTLTLGYDNNDFVNALNISNEISELLKNNKHYKFELPIINGDYKVVYDNVYTRDNIKGNNFTLRNGFKFTDIKVKVYKDKHIILEKIVKINNLNNVKDLNKAIKNKIFVYPNEFLTKYIPRGYNVKFIESSYINENGKILTDDNIDFIAEFYIVGFEKHTYNVKVEVIAGESKLDEYIKKLETNFLDIENEKIVINDLVINTSYYKEVIYYINNEEIRTEYDSFTTYNKLLSDQNAEISVMFSFNNKYIHKKLNIQRDVIEVDLLSKILNLKFKYKNTDVFVSDFNISEIFKNKRYIIFPKLLNEKRMIIRWKSLDKSKVKSNGYISNNNFDHVQFKIIVYINLFKMRRYKVIVYNKTNQ